MPNPHFSPPRKCFLFWRAAQKNQVSPQDGRAWRCCFCLTFCHASDPWEARGDVAAKGNHPNSRSLNSTFTNSFGFGLVVHTHPIPFSWVWPHRRSNYRPESWILGKELDSFKVNFHPSMAFCCTLSSIPGGFSRIKTAWSITAFCLSPCRHPPHPLPPSPQCRSYSWINLKTSRWQCNHRTYSSPQDQLWAWVS